MRSKRTLTWSLMLGAASGGYLVGRIQTTSGSLMVLDGLLLLLILLGVSALTWLLIQQRLALFRIVRAERATTRAETCLRQAIDSIAEAFVLWDRHRRLVLCNQRFFEVYPEIAELCQPGITVDQMITRYREACGARQPAQAVDRWVQARLTDLDAPSGRPYERRLPDGRWMRITDHRTADGGIVSIHTDITRQRRGAQALRESEARAARAESRLRDAIESISESFTLWDADDRLVLYNQRHLQLYPEFVGALYPGISYDDMVQIYVESDEAPGTQADRHTWIQRRRAMRREQLGRPSEWRKPDGGWLRIGDYRTADRGIVSVQADITDDKHRELALRMSEERYRSLAEAIPIGIGQVDGDQQLCYANPALCRLLEAAAPATVHGRRWHEFIAPEAHRDADQLFARTEPGDFWSYEAVLAGSRGGARHVLITGTPLRGPDPAGAGMLLTVMDISERKAAERRVEHLAHHDALCGLPNRVLFGDRLEQSLRLAVREGRRFAVCALDLDNFKDVNDTLGHAAGDTVLCTVASRLRETLRAADTVARLSGDEFALVLHQVGDQAEIDSVVTLVNQVLAEPYVADDHALHLSASIGVAVYPDHGTSAGELIRHADLALYQAKSVGGNSFAHFEPALSQKMHWRKRLEGDLRSALDQDAFHLAYQPQINPHTGQVVGAEALIRWHHETEGSIPPSEFIPVAEASGLIIPLGHWILNTACRQVQTWRAEGLPPVRMSVNLSAVQIRRPELTDVVAEALAAWEIDPASLELEITEGVLMDDTGWTRRTLERLRALGLSLSLDDFGTGFSSLGYLKRYPVDRIKIDRSFVADIGKSSQDDALVRVMIALAHSLGMEAIAEGIEEPEQLEFLRSHSCDQVQGFYLGRPMPAPAFAEFIRGPNVAQRPPPEEVAAAS